MRTIRWPAVFGLGAVVVTSACVIPIQQDPLKYALAARPAGATATIRLFSGGVIAGELIGLSTSSMFVVDSNNRIVEVPFAVVRRAAANVRGARMKAGTPPEGKALERFRLASRYPQGIDVQLLRALLQAYGQEAPLLAEDREVGPAADARLLESIHTHVDQPPGNNVAAGGALSPAAAELVEAVRRGSSRFADPQVAVAEGYRRLGPDFPGMGIHWLHPTALLDRVIDPSRPPVLTYVERSGEMWLTGVAFVIPIRAGEELPPLPAPATWHVHAGTIVEEVLHGNGGQGLATRDAHHAATHGTATRGVAMVHVWAWADNPAGAFAQDNWTLPFLRVGLQPPHQSSLPAAHALSLVSGGGDYYLARMQTFAATAAQHEALENALARSRGEADAWWRRLRGARPREADLAELSLVWYRLEANAGRILGREAALLLPEFRR